MKDPRRREFLGQTALLALAAAAPAGCGKKAPTRQAVLEAMVKELLVPDVRTVLAQSRALEGAMAALGRERTPAGLDAARGQWKQALLAWKQAYCFRSGPLIAASAFSRSLFWPTRPQTVEAMVRGRQSIDETTVPGLGVDEKGLYAVEHLLFGMPGAGAPVERPGPEGERAAALGLWLTRAVTASAARAAGELGDGRGYAASFAANQKENVELLASQLVDTVETVRTSRLARLRALAGKPLRPNEVEGLTSAMVFRIPMALITGTERLYLGGGGGGIADLVRGISPAIDARVRTGFTRTISALLALVAGPFERALAPDSAALDDACAACKSLESVLKVDASGALGLTLVFTGADAD